MSRRRLRNGGLAIAVMLPWMASVVHAQPSPADTPTDDEAAAATVPVATVPDDTHLRVDLAPRQLTVGDVATATLILEWPAGAPDVDPRFPAWQESWGDAEVLATGEVMRARGTRGQVLFTQEIQLTAFTTGDVDLPPLEVAIPLGSTTATLETPADLRLSVQSVLPPADDENAAPPAPRAAVAARALPIGSRFWWTVGVLAALCVLTAMAVARRHPTAFGGLLTVPRLPPFDELEARLAAIRPDDASERAHTQISLALRTYLGRATGVQAVERTTSEIRKLLRDGPLPLELGRRIMTLLERCDEAKFIAGLSVPPETVRQRVDEAKAIAKTIHDSQRSDDDETDDGVTASQQATQPGSPTGAAA